MKIKSITTKIIITLAISIILLMVVTGFGYYLYENNKITAEVRANTDESLKRMVLFLQSPVIEMNYYEISNIIYIEMISNKNIYAVVLENSMGEIIYAAERNNFWNPIRRTSGDIEDIRNLIDLKTSTIIHKEKNIALIKIYVTDKIIKELLFNNIFIIIIMQSITAVLFFIVLFIILKIIIISPLISLTGFIKNIEYSDSVINNVVFYDSNDEIGELSSRFNKLMLNLNNTLNQKNSLLNQLADNNEALQREIKERIFAEEKLKSSQKYTETVLNSINSMLFTVNSNLEIIEMNNEARIFTKITSIDRKIKIDKLITFLAPYKSVIEKFTKRTERGEISFIKNKIDHQTFYYTLFIIPFKHKEEQLSLLRLEDITELVKKDTQLSYSLKMESIRDLAGGISHDFNNILGGILGAVFLAKTEAEQENIELYDNLMIIEAGAKRATELVKQLLSISGKGDIKQRPLNLNTAVENIYKLSLNSFDKTINITFKPYDDNPPFIYGDTALIEQVILNIAINACHSMTIMRKKTEDWGGSLTIEVAKDFFNPPSNDISLENISLEYYSVTITDTGVGIKDSDISKIFDPFFTRKKEKGSGLGLSIVYNIIKQHRGHIFVDSKYKYGTTVKILLPVFNNMGNEETPSDENEVFPKGEGTILVIEDEEIMRKVVREMLIKCGYDVILANDGLEGLEIFKRNHENIKIVLLDMIMPKISGKETYKDLKKIKKNVKVILTSGFQLDERVEKTLEMGADEFIQKPYLFKELSEKVYKLIN